MNPKSSEGWETYSKLVLQQLETLAGGIESLRDELQDVKSRLTELGLERESGRSGITYTNAN